MLKKPKALTRNSKVAIVSLSSGILGESLVAHQRSLGIKRLKQMGLNPIFMPNSLKGIDYLSKNPKARADDLKTAFADTEIDGIICAIGGNDTYRLLPYLLDDSIFVKHVQEHPKLFSGFSDTTINHLMFYKLGMESFYGPNFLSDLAELGTSMLSYTKDAFKNYFKDEQKTEIISAPIWYDERTDFSSEALGTKRVYHTEQHGYEVLRGEHQMNGKLLGGCLDSLYECLSSTRYPDKAAIIEHYHLFPANEEWKDKILFIETSEEKPSPSLYKKMLMALENKGVLSMINGIIVGKPQDEMFYEDYKDVLLEIAASYKLPIVYNINFGHAYPRAIIPYGCEVQVDFDKKKLTIMEPLFSN